MKEQTKNLTENKDTLKKIMDQFEKQKGKSKKPDNMYKYKNQHQ